MVEILLGFPCHSCSAHQLLLLQLQVLQAASAADNDGNVARDENAIQVRSSYCICRRSRNGSSSGTDSC